LIVIEEILNECPSDERNISGSGGLESEFETRTTRNWWGENEEIPIEYLIPSKHISIEDTIKNNPFCAHLDNDQLKILIDNCKTISIDSEKVICYEGDKADKVYIILDGKVKVYKKDSNDNETELATIEKGNMFGEMALFDKGIRSASVRSIEPCQLLIIEGDKFLELLLG